MPAKGEVVDRPKERSLRSEASRSPTLDSKLLLLQNRSFSERERGWNRRTGWKGSAERKKIKLFQSHEGQASIEEG